MRSGCWMPNVDVNSGHDMCTFIMKTRGDTVLVLRGIGCCRRVEDVQDVAPDISAANGWKEVFVGTSFPGKRTIDVELDDQASSALRNEKLFAELTYRGRTIHFRDRGRLAATLEYVEGVLRNTSSFPEHRVFLEGIPAVFLKGSARATVAKKLRSRLAASVPNVTRSTHVSKRSPK